MRSATLAAAGIVAVMVGAIAVAAYLHAPASTTRRYPVAWHLASGAVATAQSTSFPVFVEDDKCASGVPAAKRLRPPDIDYSKDAVTVTLTAELADTFHSCPEAIGPGVNIATIHLDEPLGDRSLIDGYTSASPTTR
jgi:hypothetical protein